jgi:hypothetical protein
MVSFLTEGHLFYLTNIICDLLLAFRYRVANCWVCNILHNKESAESNKRYQSP